MRSQVLAFVFFGACVFSSVRADAQTTDLASGAADPIWRGTAAGARAGEWLDQGAVSHGDSRRDLVLGVPGDASLTGRVYVIFGGSVRSGDLSLASADTVINGAAAGDLFGTVTATGNILSLEGTNPKTLVVGAPGALSRRGIVYVYAAGFRNGDALSTADAVVQIIGNTGDRLGTSLATADLNNDGYREIVIGAPGNERVYVIAGGPMLAGTIDLSVQPAAVALSAPGGGTHLAAGDVTGDGIYDLLVGQPAFNVVNILKGRNGTMPAAAFDMTFGGIDAGDGVGASVRLADVDADGTSDIVVGASGADGPSNSRPDAGEVYLIWGGPTVSGRSLMFADVTFYGSEPGARMGALLSAGDINRDTPNDLVFTAGGARGGAGALHVYYGRKNRSSIGVPRGDGPRIVDFANESPDRSILGDTAGGTITASIVYEVTGEGARDIIVGMSGNNDNTGAVYFTISPRLSLGSPSVSLRGFQGISSSSPVPVRNISDIAITWQTSSNRTWLSATPSGSTSASAFGDVVISGNADGLAMGTHTGTITVISTSIHLTMSQTIAVTFEVEAARPVPATPPQPGWPPGASYNLLWRHTDGWLAFWQMNGLTMVDATSLSIPRTADPNWRVAGMGDLDGDGQKDLVWQHETGGWLAAWLLNGREVVSAGQLSTNQMTDSGWKIRAVGDTDADGKADLLWQHADGRVMVWFMNGRQVLATAPLSINRLANLAWLLCAAGDINGDGRADLLWQNTSTGDLAAWFMNGAQVTRTSILSIPRVNDMGWGIVGAQDVNGDGRADILWQHTVGTIATWFMNAENVVSTSTFNPPRANAGWRVAGPK